MRSNQFAQRCNLPLPRIHRCTDRRHVALDHAGDVSATQLFLTNDLDLSGLSSCVNGLKDSREPLGFNETQCIHTSCSFFSCCLSIKKCPHPHDLSMK